MRAIVREGPERILLVMPTIAMVGVVVFNRRGPIPIFPRLQS